VEPDRDFLFVLPVDKFAVSARMSPYCTTMSSLKYFLSFSDVCDATVILENCALLGRYTKSIGNLLPTFRDTLLVPTSVGKVS